MKNKMLSSIKELISRIIVTYEVKEVLFSNKQITIELLNYGNIIIFENGTVLHTGKIDQITESIRISSIPTSKKK